MGNINMPTPVAFAVGALCVFGGYLVGVVTGPDPNTRSTAEVASFDDRTDELCLTGEAVTAVPQTDGGVLCGIWRHRQGVDPPAEGDRFRFVTMRNESAADGDGVTYIYGDVVR